MFYLKIIILFSSQNSNNLDSSSLLGKFTRLRINIKIIISVLIHQFRYVHTFNFLFFLSIEFDIIFNNIMRDYTPIFAIFLFKSLLEFIHGKFEFLNRVKRTMFTWIGHNLFWNKWKPKHE